MASSVEEDTIPMTSCVERDQNLPTTSVSSSSVNNDDNLDFLPEKLRNALLPFQRDGVKYGLEKSGCLLIADDMGLGKTVQALCIAFKFKAEWPLLIVTPSSMRYPWIEEIEKWLPEVDPRKIRLIISQGDINEISSDRVDVVVVSYGLFSTARRAKDYKTFYRPPLVEAMFRAEFKVVILDESHYVKNPSATRTENVVDIVKKAKRRILLTGTPALARPSELYSQIDSILPGAFGTWQWFAKRYCDAKYRIYGKKKQWDTNGASNLEELQNKLIGKLMIRRLKSEVLPQLPPKTRQRIPFEVTQSEYKKKIDETWKELSGFISEKNLTVSRIIKMVQSNQFDDEKEGEEENDGEESVKPKKKYYSEKHFLRCAIRDLSHATGMAKVGPVIEYLRLLLKNPQEKFLVFAHHKSVVEGLAGELTRLSAEGSKDAGGNFRFIRIDGGVPSEMRMQLVRQFQTDPETRVALLSIMAAGTGLTFTAGSHVVFAELHWTPGVLQQCEDRVHRIGQKRNVHIHYLVTRDTIDEWLWAALTRKTQVVSLALNGITQTLNAEEELDKDKLNQLAAASCWVPPEEPKHDDDEVFFNQTYVPEDQSMITDFFRSGAKSKEKPKKAKFWKKQKEGEGEEEEEQKTDSSFLKRNRRKRTRVELLATQGDSCVGEDFLSQSREEQKKKSLKRANKSGRKGKTAKGKVKEMLDDPFEMAVMEEEEQGVEEGNPLEMALLEEEEKDNSFENASVVDKDVVLGTDTNRVEGDSHQPVDCPSTPKSRSSSSTNEPIRWSCKSCTFLNYPSLRSCEICDSPRRLKRSRVAGIGEDQQSQSRTRGLGTQSERINVNQPDDFNLNDAEKISQSTDAADKVDIDAALQVIADDRNDISRSNGDETLGPTTSPSQVFTSTPARQKIFEPSKLLLPQTPTLLSQRQPPLSPGPNLPPQPPLLQAQMDTMSEETDVKNDLPPESGIPDDMFDSWDEDDFNEDDDVTASSTSNNQQQEQQQQPPRVIDLAKLPVYSSFLFFVSRNTERIYVYDSEQRPLNINFLPLDVETDNWAAIPDVLLHPKHISRLRTFLREWNALTETKKRVIKKSGEIFASPKAMYDEMVRNRKHCVDRKLDVAVLNKAAEKKAAALGGSTRLLNPKAGGFSTELDVGTSNASSSSAKASSVASPDSAAPTLTSIFTSSSSFSSAASSSSASASSAAASSASSAAASSASSAAASSASSTSSVSTFVQALDSNDNPMCLWCQNPISNSLSKSLSSRDDVAWHTRFCRRECREEYLVKRAETTYIRQELLLAEKGICQICGVAAHELFVKMNEEKNKEKRAEMIKGSIFDKMRSFSKNRMVTKPTPGDFWQADHRLAVAEGGGQCDIGNFRTLCTICHAQETKSLMERVRKKKKMEKVAASMAGCPDLKSFYKSI